MENEDQNLQSILGYPIIFFIDEVREWVKQINNKELSFSKFAEILNERAAGIKPEQPLLLSMDLAKDGSQKNGYFIPAQESIIQSTFSLWVDKDPKQWIVQTPEEFQKLLLGNWKPGYDSESEGNPLLLPEDLLYSELITLPEGVIERAQMKEFENSEPKKVEYIVCPKCESPFPHSHTDGSYSCEECGETWRYKNL